MVDWEARLMDLEMKLSFQEDTIEKLNQIARQLSEQLDLQQAQLRFLYQQQQQNGGALRGNLREEVPPHY